jgi:CheY-like chemotaxis protein
MSNTLLIVDDSATTRAFIRRTVQLAGYDTGIVHEAGDGRAALDLLKSHSVDLVLADLNMPGMDGEQLIRQMHDTESLKQIPVVLVTADPNLARLQQLRQGYAIGVVRKPFTPEALRNALQYVIGGIDA